MNSEFLVVPTMNRMGEVLTRWKDLRISGGASVANGDHLRWTHGHFGMAVTINPTRFLSLDSWPEWDLPIFQG